MQFSTQIGINHGNELKTSTNSQPGFLVFGPYLSLPKGKYKFTFELDITNRTNSQDVGYYEFIYMHEKKTVILYQSPLEPNKKSINGSFDLPVNVTNFEFRIFSKANANLNFRKLYLSRP